jgi:WD40 repeat protein
VKVEGEAATLSLMRLADLVDVVNQGSVYWHDLTSFCVDANRAATSSYSSSGSLLGPDSSYSAYVCPARHLYYRRNPSFVDRSSHCQEIRGVAYAAAVGLMVVVEGGHRTVNIYASNMRKLHVLRPAQSVREHASRTSRNTTKPSRTRSRKSEVRLSSEDVLAAEYLGLKRKMQVCISCGDGNLSVWDIVTGRLLRHLWVRHHEVGLRYCPTSDVLISWSNTTSDGGACCRVRAVSSLSVLVLLQGAHRAEIRDVCEISCPEDASLDTTVCSTGMDGRVILWGLEIVRGPSSSVGSAPQTHALNHIRHMRAFKLCAAQQRYGVMSLAHSSQQNLILVAGFDTDVYGLDSRTLQQRLVLRGHKCSIIGVRVVRFGERICEDTAVTVDMEGAGKVWNISSSESSLHAQCLQTFYCEAGLATSCRVRPHCISTGWDESLVVTSSKVHLFEKLAVTSDADTMEVPQQLELSGHSGEIGLVRQQQGGGRASVHFISASTGLSVRQSCAILPDGRDATATCIEPRHKLLFVGCQDGTIGAHHAITGALRSSHVTQSAEITALVYVSGDETLISVSCDGRLGIHDARCTGSDLPILREVARAHDSDILLVCCSRRLGLIATAAADTTLRVWDYFTLALHSIPRGHGQYSLTAMTFLDPLAALATSDSSGLIIIWEASPSKQLKKLFSIICPDGSLPSRLAFHLSYPDTNIATQWLGRLAAADERGVVAVWKFGTNITGGEVEVDRHRIAGLYYEPPVSTMSPASGRQEQFWATASESLLLSHVHPDRESLMRSLSRDGDDNGSDDDLANSYDCGCIHLQPELEHAWQAHSGSTITYITYTYEHQSCGVLATSGSDGVTRFWSAGDARLLGVASPLPNEQGVPNVEWQLIPLPAHWQACLQRTPPAEVVPGQPLEVHTGSRSEHHDGPGSEAHPTASRSTFAFEDLFSQIHPPTTPTPRSVDDISLPTSVALQQHLTKDISAPYKVKGRENINDDGLGDISVGECLRKERLKALQDAQIRSRYTHLYHELNRKAARKTRAPLQSLLNDVKLPMSDRPTTAPASFQHVSSIASEGARGVALRPLTSGSRLNRDRSLKGLLGSSHSAKVRSGRKAPPQAGSRPRSAFVEKIDGILDRLTSDQVEEGQCYSSIDFNEEKLAAVLLRFQEAFVDEATGTQQQAHRPAKVQFLRAKQRSLPNSGCGAQADPGKRRIRDEDFTAQIGLCGTCPVSRFAGPYTVEQVLHLRNIFKLFEVSGTDKAPVRDLAGNALLSSDATMSKAIRLAAETSGGSFIALPNLLPAVFRYAKKEEIQRMRHVIQVAALVDRLAAVPSPQSMLHSISSFDPNFLSQETAIAPHIYRLPHAMSADVDDAFSYAEREGCGSLTPPDLYHVLHWGGLLTKVGCSSLVSFLQAVDMCGIDEHKEVTAKDFKTIVITLWAGSGEGGTRAPHAGSFHRRDATGAALVIAPPQMAV